MRGTIFARRFDAEPTFPVKQWSEALQLATTWGFVTLRKFIIEHLDSLLKDPLGRIELADQCDVKEWLHPAYAKLCAQGTPLTVKEGRVLGLERFAALCRIREEGMKRGGYPSRCEEEEEAYPDPPAFQGFYGWQQPNHVQRNHRGSGPTREVPDCQRKCCQPPFQLSSTEKGFLAAIAKAEDL